MRWPFVPLQWQRIPITALLVAVVLVVVGGTLIDFGERAYRAQRVDEAEVQARILASIVEAALYFKDQDAGQQYVQALERDPEVRAAAIRDLDGTVLASYARDTGRALLPPANQPPGTYPTETGLAVVAPVLHEGRTLGTVYVDRTLEPLSRRVERDVAIALFILMAALVVGVLGVAQSTLRRVNEELASRAGALAAANRELETQIQERERVEAALRQSQKMEAIGQLTGGVAHDFNNLLQVILGNLDVLRRRMRQGADIDDLGRRLEAASRAAEQGGALTQRLLAFSRRQPLDPKPSEVNKLVAGMSDLLHRSLGETITIETVLAGGLWQVSVDANQLESALLNLAVNARDAMAGGGKLTIETANAYLDDAYVAQQEDLRAGQYVVIQVTDTGHGMTPDILLKVFDPFFTTKELGKGTGLGLSQVYGFIKQSGGHTQIYSEPGKGTTVKLYLPRFIGPIPTPAPVEATVRAAGGVGELILVVEDQPEVREFSVQTLRGLGYGVIEAPDGQTALLVLAANPNVKLLFTDVGLPGGLTGRQLADQAQKVHPGLKVLYTTGYARNAIVHNGQLDPGVHLISKPFPVSALAAKVRQVLNE